MLTIGFDIDSTINKAHYYDIIHGRELCKEMNFTPKENLNKCSVKEMFGFNDHLYNIYMDRYFPWNCKYNDVEAGYPELIRALKRNGHIVKIITARDDTYNSGNYTGEMMKADTINWLNEKGIIYDEIRFNCRDKSKACKDYNVDILNDDDPQHILNCVKNNIPVIIASQSYNEHLIGTPLTYYSHSPMDILNYLNTTNLLLDNKRKIFI